MPCSNDRRGFLNLAGIATGGLIVGALATGVPRAGADKGEEVGAVEDLMREHGVLRRALLVYSACAERLRADPLSLPVEPIRKTANLFRAFGEDYHERKLEEPHIFPVVRKVQGPAAQYPDILVAQHNRGREITDYILGVSRGDRLTAADAGPLARALEAFVLMYRHHAAQEDTVVFPAWKDALSAEALEEMGEKFEDIEHAEFGKDGFEDAVATIGAIEQALGIADIAQFTAPAPPKS
jgi:hemerythrin-like domain-containing protein